jgi:hypothetical protein
VEKNPETAQVTIYVLCWTSPKIALSRQAQGAKFIRCLQLSQFNEILIT